MNRAPSFRSCLPQATRRLLIAVLTGAALTVTACGGPKTIEDNSNGDAGPIVIGASIPLSGNLAGFGSFVKWGYETAVKEVNDAGGIQIGDAKRKVDLVILDDKTDPNQTSANTEKLISAENATALLGSCTPALVIPGALVADRNGVPLVTGCIPTGLFSDAKPWTWAWAIFFSERDIVNAPFETVKSSGAATNKKVAIIHDNGPDGVVVGKQAWPAVAKAYGYEVVANVEVPVENADFTAAVQQVKRSRADVLLVDVITPQAVSLRKQMATGGYTPKVLVMEKGGEPVQFPQALGSLADGVLVGAYWDPSFPYAGAKELAQAYERESGQDWSQHIADSYTAAKVLLDAIARAGSTDRQKINDAIRATDAMYPAGKVKFSDQHTAVLDLAYVQWQGGKTVVVWPPDKATGSLLFPMPAR
jgi:branched-chain amino acid transport system substrate-binding protein